MSAGQRGPLLPGIPPLALVHVHGLQGAPAHLARDRAQHMGYDEARHLVRPVAHRTPLFEQLNLGSALHPVVSALRRLRDGVSAGQRGPLLPGIPPLALAPTTTL